MWWYLKKTTKNVDLLKYVICNTNLLVDLKWCAKISKSFNAQNMKKSGLGYHPLPGQNSRASTCYAVGGMFLAFTQEKCLVLMLFHLAFYLTELLIPYDNFIWFGGIS